MNKKLNKICVCSTTYKTNTKFMFKSALHTSELEKKKIEENPENGAYKKELYW